MSASENMSIPVCNGDASVFLFVCADENKYDIWLFCEHEQTGSIIEHDSVFGFSDYFTNTSSAAIKKDDKEISQFYCRKLVI